MGGAAEQTDWRQSVSSHTPCPQQQPQPRGVETDRGRPRTHIAASRPCADSSITQPLKAVKSAASVLPEALRARNPYGGRRRPVLRFGLSLSLFCCHALHGTVTAHNHRREVGIPVESRFCLGPSEVVWRKKKGKPGSWRLEPITAWHFPFPTVVAWSIFHVASAEVTSARGHF